MGVLRLIILLFSVHRTQSCLDYIVDQGTLFYSTHFPDDYPNDLYECWKLISVDTGGTVSVEFQNFATENSYDFVTIYDGATTSSSELETLSGTVSDGHTVQSTGQFMTVLFQTDSSRQNMGFQACGCTTGTVCSCEYVDVKGDRNRTIIIAVATPVSVVVFILICVGVYCVCCGKTTPGASGTHMRQKPNQVHNVQPTDPAAAQGRHQEYPAANQRAGQYPGANQQPVPYPTANQQQAFNAGTPYSGAYPPPAGSGAAYPPPGGVPYPPQGGAPNPPQGGAQYPPQGGAQYPPQGGAPNPPPPGGVVYGPPGGASAPPVPYPEANSYPAPPEVTCPAPASYQPPVA